MSDEGWVTRSLTEFFEDETQELTNLLPKFCGQFHRTSDPTTDYNCLSWAVSENERFFDPTPHCAGYFWPEGIARNWQLSTVKQVLARYGFTEDSFEATYEVGFEKVAIFLDSAGEVTHFARQLPNGNWTSKLGDLIDVEHYSLDCLEGDDPYYGEVQAFVKKRLSP